MNLPLLWNPATVGLYEDQIIYDYACLGKMLGLIHQAINSFSSYESFHM